MGSVILQMPGWIFEPCESSYIGNFKILQEVDVSNLFNGRKTDTI